MHKDLSKYSDQYLIQATLRKKKQRNVAFMELYKRYSKSVFTYCRNKFFDKDNATEVFEQSFVEFYKAIESGKEILNVQAYLFGIVRNILAGRIREKEKNRERFINMEVSGSNKSSNKIVELKSNIDIEKTFENYELLKLIEDAVELLEEEEKEYYKLNKFGGMSAAKIADIFDVNINYVKSKIYRSQLKIKEILSPYIEEIKKY